MTNTTYGERELEGEELVRYLQSRFGYTREKAMSTMLKARGFE